MEGGQAVVAAGGAAGLYGGAAEVAATAGAIGTAVASSPVGIAGLAVVGLGAAGYAVKSWVEKNEESVKEEAKEEPEGQTDLETHSKSRSEALGKAKAANDISRRTHPDKMTRAGTEAGRAIGLDERNKCQYEYTNDRNEKISIREDKAAEYGDGGKGDQGPHFNAGPQGEPLKQHHYFSGE